MREDPRTLADLSREMSDEDWCLSQGIAPENTEEDR